MEHWETFAAIPAYDWYVPRGWVPVGRVDDQGSYVALTRG